jgi:hypothetical protein
VVGFTKALHARRHPVELREPRSETRHPTPFVITSDDGLTPPNDAFVEAVGKSGDQKVSAVHIPTDHSCSDHRVALQQAVLDGLARSSRK